MQSASPDPNNKFHETAVAEDEVSRLSLPTIWDFWRVGYYGAPASAPSAASQGDGRFDDPDRAVPILYAAEDLETCVYEIIDAMGVAEHPQAAAILRDVPVPTTPDEALDAERDYEIARRPRRVPRSFFEREGIHVELEAGAVSLVDLRDTETRSVIAGARNVWVQLKAAGFDELDMSAVMSDRRRLTQAITREFLIGEFAGTAHGILSLSRRSSKPIYALFADGRFPLEFRTVCKTMRFTAFDPLVTKVAKALGLMP